VNALGQGANAYAANQALYKKTTVENPYGGGMDPLQGVQPPATIENPGYGDLQNRGLHTNIENPYYGVGALSLENRGLHRRN
jgi:hypothetical protein